MRYIIDGCNFIKKFAGGVPFDFEGEKTKLLDRLRRYSSGRHVEITVVFDSSMPSFETTGKVAVIHAPDADKRIVSEVRKMRAPASASVVSDDRAVKRAAREDGASASGVIEFDRFLAKTMGEGAVKASGSGEKPSPEDMSEEDIRDWEEYFRR